MPGLIMNGIHETVEDLGPQPTPSIQADIPGFTQTAGAIGDLIIIQGLKLKLQDEDMIRRPCTCTQMPAERHQQMDAAAGLIMLSRQDSLRRSADESETPPNMLVPGQSPPSGHSVATTPQALSRGRAICFADVHGTAEDRNVKTFLCQPDKLSDTKRCGQCLSRPFQALLWSWNHGSPVNGTFMWTIRLDAKVFRQREINGLWCPKHQGPTMEAFKNFRADVERAVQAVWHEETGGMAHHSRWCPWGRLLHTIGIIDDGGELGEETEGDAASQDEAAAMAPPELPADRKLRSQLESSAGFSEERVPAVDIAPGQRQTRSKSLTQLGRAK